MRLSGQFQASLFTFFLQKDVFLSVTSKNQVTKQKQANTKQQRQQIFVRTKNSKRVKIVCFALWYNGFLDQSNNIFQRDLIFFL